MNTFSRSEVGKSVSIVRGCSWTSRVGVHCHICFLICVDFTLLFIPDHMTAQQNLVPWCTKISYSSGPICVEIIAQNGAKGSDSASDLMYFAAKAPLVGSCYKTPDILP